MTFGKRRANCATVSSLNPAYGGEMFFYPAFILYFVSPQAFALVDIHDVRLDYAGVLERAGRRAEARVEYERLANDRETPDDIRNHPVLKGVTIPRTGQRGYAGTLVTKTLLVAGETGFTTTPFGRGAMLRAYDKANGKEVGAVYMPAPQSGSPMTYMANGKQYIVVAVSGGNYSGEFLAFRLPG